ncbi:GNAT family N-acetyltransferase [Neolewinella aurantiaca]|uniref:GNAT family N-acetyltransferase n=1 Tax=Neolewinella aurantiaca TaxID=2602767 RepID=A0A5C7FYF4_9BACT|nr:GNAT family N-acetyltransferase [Neolewinella aurantiaca]TXF90123.1 GNAT family N-acetyltransferase [Neolewinella aurantiaca]
MNIRLALPADVDDVYRLYDEARSHLRSQGIFQWPDSYPSLNVVSRDANNEELYVFETDGLIAGAVCLNEQQDEAYASIDWKVPDLCPLVIHRLVVAPKFQRKGIARKMMDFSEDLAERNGYASVRLDAYTGHERVGQFYKSRGYICRGQVRFPERELPFWCFELEVTGNQAI